MRNLLIDQQVQHHGSLDRSGRIVVVDDRVDPRVTPAASTGKVSKLSVGRTGNRDCWTAGQLPFPGKRRGRSVFPVRIPQQAWERVNILPYGRVNDVHG